MATNLGKQGPQHSNWVFTYPYGGNGQPSKDDVHEFWEGLCEKAYYAIAGFEKGEGGQLHLQGYVQLDVKQRLTQLKKLPKANTVHWEPARGDEESNERYCTKENGEILRHGDEPRIINAGKRAKRDYATALEMAKADNIDNIDPTLLVQYFRTWQLIKDSYAAKANDLAAGSKMMWIYGPTGTGKSRSARQLFEDMGEVFYNKLQNKWWDHYKNERCVLIDDLGLETGRALVNFLKLWLDMYVFKAEYKGGAMDIRPRLIVITSNYHPHEIFGETKDFEPIMRRLSVIYVGSPQEEYVVPHGSSESSATGIDAFVTKNTFQSGLARVRDIAKKLKLCDTDTITIDEETEDEEGISGDEDE